MDLITEIQASPREFAAKYETMRAALEAVTAEREDARREYHKAADERDAARREVARLTKIVERHQTEWLDGLADNVAELDATLRGDTAPATDGYAFEPGVKAYRIETDDDAPAGRE